MLTKADTGFDKQDCIVLNTGLEQEKSVALSAAIMNRKKSDSVDVKWKLYDF